MANISEGNFQKTIINSLTIESIKSMTKDYIDNGKISEDDRLDIENTIKNNADVSQQFSNYLAEYSSSKIEENGNLEPTIARFVDVVMGVEGECFTSSIRHFKNLFIQKSMTEGREGEESELSEIIEKEILKKFEAHKDNTHSSYELVVDVLADHGKPKSTRQRLRKT